MSTNLPILNYDFALNQLGGNEALLSKMLGRFVSEFADVSNEVMALIEDNDFHNAKMKVHTVKGISGNLGLQALYDCSTRFDALLRVSETNQAIADEFSRLVTDTCTEIRNKDLKDTSQANLSESTHSREQSKTELINRLDKNEFIDDETLTNLIAGLGIEEAAAFDLIQLIEELQYPKAIDVLKKIPN
ncbi:MAG: HPt (histidine-containing phosphotransfer) domain-containing protein [Glaciecola sp.]|jgi:HPt (histidine-containing phosphotransfer) domain-containing protein